MLFKISRIDNKKLDLFIDAFNDCIRYSKATILEQKGKEAVIKIPTGCDRSLWLNLCIDRFKNFGFCIKKVK